MKNTILLVAIVLGIFPTARAITPPTLTSARAIRSLSRAEANRGLPVVFEATVTYYRDYRRNLFVQNKDGGVFVKADTRTKLVPGDRVLVKGITSFGYSPSVVSSDITVVGHGPIPAAVKATFDGLIKGRFDGQLVTIHGLVRSADMNEPSTDHARGANLRVLLDGGYVEAEVVNADEQQLPNLLDTEVEVTGVGGGKFDGKFDLTGVAIHLNGLDDIKIVKRSAVDPWSLPESQMDKILDGYFVENRSSRVRVSGIVTYYEPGSALVLQNGAKSIWVKTSNYDPVRIGDKAEVIGIPGVSLGFLTIAGSEIRDLGIAAPVTPQPVSWQQLAASRHIFDLVSIEGKVAMRAREANQDEYVLTAEGHSFSTIFPHPRNSTTPAPLASAPIGSVVRVTGICAMNNANPFGHNVPFNILMRTPGDIVVLTNPPWITVHNLGILAIVLLLCTIAAGSRALYAGRKMRSQVANLGYIGSRRARILEDINNAQPLAGILESITELASMSLKGACCWCQIADGARLGNCPPQLESSGLRVVSHTIAAHTGPSLGTIYAAFDARTKPHAEEAKALSSAAELATLAIETRRLHADLVHRSEFDLLTDVQNRFSFEKHLDRLIGEARNSAGIFGVIYIDLDDFKSVNDLHGHQVGDLYLQQVTSRMKRQLRPGDMLARLGGDEFAVLVPAARNRSDVEEVAERLEYSFHEPFVVQGCVLTRSASVGIALYPEDAVSGDTLVTLADAAMYSTKQQSQQRALRR